MILIIVQPTARCPLRAGSRAQSGIILTASHNPAKYNGYKCYNKNGYQMTDGTRGGADLPLY